MSIFHEVGLTWKGVEYTVAPERVMGLIEVVEDVLTLEELHSGGLKRAKLARAYMSALHYAGCREAKHEDLYKLFYSTDDSEGALKISDMITSLLMMMIPPDSITKDLPSDPKPSPPAEDSDS